MEHSRYKTPFFKDLDIQKAIQEEGYFTCKLLGDNELKALKKDAKELLKVIPFRQKRWKFISAGRIIDPEIRMKSNRSIEKHILPQLKPFFHDNLELIPGVHLIKPPSPASILNCHQDSALVDERVHMSVYAWIPLVDLTKRNGALSIIPKSHSIDLYQRSLEVPWELEPYIKTLNKLQIPVYAKAGDVVFFDAALLHGSPNNLSTGFRIAVNVFIKPKIANYLHFYMEDRDGDEVEVYHVSPKFYIKQDISKRPSEPFKLLRIEKRQYLNLSEEELINYFS